MITIYTSMLCPCCTRAKNLLAAKQVAFNEIDVSYDPKMRAEMRSKAGSNAVPQIWIGETHVGGSDQLLALEQSGDLDRLLTDTSV